MKWILKRKQRPLKSGLFYCVYFLKTKIFSVAPCGAPKFYFGKQKRKKIDIWKRESKSIAFSNASQEAITKAYNKQITSKAYIRTYKEV